MRAIGAGARHKFGMAVDEQCDIAPLHNLGRRFGAVDQRALIAPGQPQQHRGNIGGGQRRLDFAGKSCRVVEACPVKDWREQIKPLARRIYPPPRSGGGGPSR
jgi:hypothetical protein